VPASGGRMRQGFIEQNTLELRYTDGRIKRFAFVAFRENLMKKPAAESFLLYEQRLERY